MIDRDQVIAGWPCPTCNARRGKTCTRRNGGPRKQQHIARWEAAGVPRDDLKRAAFEKQQRKPRCPTPKLKRYRNQIAASLAAERDFADRPGGYGHGRDHAVEPFLCPTGTHWHHRIADRKG